MEHPVCPLYWLTKKIRDFKIGKWYSLLLCDGSGRPCGPTSILGYNIGAGGRYCEYAGLGQNLKLKS